MSGWPHSTTCALLATRCYISLSSDVLSSKVYCICEIQENVEPKFRNEAEHVLWTRNRMLGSKPQQCLILHSSSTSWVILDEEKLCKLHYWEHSVPRHATSRLCSTQCFTLSLDQGLIIRSLGPRPSSCLYHAYFSGTRLWFEPQGVLLNKWVTQESVSQSCWYVYFLPLTNTPWFLIIFQVVSFAQDS